MPLTLPAGPFRALLFDCVGTIADSMPLHYIAWKQALAEWNCVFPEDVFYAWGGMPAAEIVATLGAQQGIAMPAEEVAHRKELLYYELLPQLQPVPEVLEQINLNWSRNGSRLPMAVVSGSTRDSVTRSLEILGLQDRFDTLVCAGDYTRSKPTPNPSSPLPPVSASPPPPASSSRTPTWASPPPPPPAWPRSKSSSPGNEVLSSQFSVAGHPISAGRA